MKGVVEGGGVGKIVVGVGGGGGAIRFGSRQQTTGTLLWY